MPTLNSSERHMLRLAQRDKDADGWCKVSKVVWPFVESLPGELVELRPSDDGGHVRLTDEGDIVLNWT